MNVLDLLSTSVKDRTQSANRAAADKILADLKLLDELAPGLKSTNDKLVGDCVEVFTMVAEKQPAAVAPYVSEIVPLLNAKAKRIRWEAMHTLAFTARHIPKQMDQLMPQLMDAIVKDESVIVRDYAIQSLGEYASTSTKAAQTAYPYMVKALGVWAGRHAHFALEALAKVASTDPSLIAKVAKIAQKYKNHEKAKVKKTAAAILRKLNVKT